MLLLLLLLLLLPAGSSSSTQAPLSTHTIPYKPLQTATITIQVVSKAPHATATDGVRARRLKARALVVAAEADESMSLQHMRHMQRVRHMMTATVVASGVHPYGVLGGRGAQVQMGEGRGGDTRGDGHMSELGHMSLFVGHIHGHVIF